ncbi:MAG TPA: hypothetical protein VII40_14340 [Xanthobacteraceae bacterium]
MYSKRFAAIALSLLVAGCAIHPLPEDVTGVDTAGIVKQIRCETRDAAREMIRKQLEKLATYSDEATATIAKNLLAQYAENVELMTEFNPSRSFPGPDYAQIRNIFNLFNSGAIAYSFELTMHEDNNLGSTNNFLGPWNNKLMLNLMGDFNRSRENYRTFTIADKFSFLLKELNTPKNGHYYCDGQIAVANYIYPIAGRIGVYKMVYDFFQMSIFDNLAAQKAAPGAVGAPAMGEKLTFTTTLDLTVGPKVTFAPFVKGFQVTDAAFTGIVKRVDMHLVTVGLALEPNGIVALTSLRGYVFSGAGLGGTRLATSGPRGGQTLILNRITAAATSNAEALALVQIDQIKSRDLQIVPTLTSP